MITLLLASVAPETSPESISVETALMLLLTGGLFYGLKLIGDINRRLDQVLAPATAPKSAAAPAAPTPPASTATTPEVLAAISAAVHVAVAGKHRIVGVISVAPSDARTWSVEGRREVFRSHQLR